MSDNPDQGVWSSEQLPASWQWVNFHEFWSDFTSSQKKLPQQSYLPQGTFPVIDQGQELVGGYSDAENLLSDASPPAIVFGDHTRACKFIETPFIQGADGVRVLKSTPVVDPKYAYYALKTLQLPDKGYSRHFKFLKASLFPLAPEPEQCRIVAKLDGLRTRSARASHELDCIPKLIERYKQAILAKAFSGDLTADWRRTNPVSGSASSLIERAKVASGTTRPSKQVTRKLLPDAQLPASWASERLENLCSLIVDGTHFTPTYTPNGVPFISVKDIRDRKIYFDDCRYVSEQTHDALSARCNPTPGDILLTKSGTIGRLAIVPQGQMFSLFVSVALLRPAIPDLLPAFMMYALEFWTGHIDVSQEIAGSAIKNLHLQDIKALEAPVPPTEEQAEILRRLGHMLAWLDKIVTEHTRAEHLLPKLDQAILAKAFRGELVPQNPNDEPASVLLERIRAGREGVEEPKRRRGRE